MRTLSPLTGIECDFRVKQFVGGDCWRLGATPCRCTLALGVVEPTTASPDRNKESQQHSTTMATSDRLALPSAGGALLRCGGSWGLRERGMAGVATIARDGVSEPEEFPSDPDRGRVTSWNFRACIGCATVTSWRRNAATGYGMPGRLRQSRLWRRDKR